MGRRRGGRLKITAKFSGRSAMDVFGRCMGMGDSFDLTIVASPVARKGVIAMDDVHVTTVKDSYYIRRVRAALRQLRQGFQDRRSRSGQEPAGAARRKASYQAGAHQFRSARVRVTPTRWCWCGIQVSGQIEDPMQPVNIGVVGLGNVGSGTSRYPCGKRSRYRAETGFPAGGARGVQPQHRVQEDSGRVRLRAARPRIGARWWSIPIFRSSRS